MQSFVAKQHNTPQIIPCKGVDSYVYSPTFANKKHKKRAKCAMNTKVGMDPLCSTLCSLYLFTHPLPK